MFVFTHMKIANYFYKYMKKEGNDIFKINPIAFAYGSIKPDISEMSRVKHHLLDTEQMYHSHLTTVTDDLETSFNRSVAFGVVIHFLCDYFCKFHAKEPFKSNSIISHLIYELKLHYCVTFRLLGNFFADSHVLKDPFKHRAKNVGFTNEDVAMNEIMNFSDDSFDLSTILKTLLVSYHTKKETLGVDIDFAMYAINESMAILFGERVFPVNKNQKAVEVIGDIGIDIGGLKEGVWQ